MTAIRSFVALAATAFIATGCASTGSSMASSSDGPLPPFSEPTTLEVHNNNWSDIVVYAVQYNSRVRLGTVTSMSTARFELSPTLTRMSDLQLVARPLATSTEFYAGPILVSPGGEVELRLENQLGISNWVVR